MFAIILIVY